MLFKPELRALILAGKKTETRRPIRDGEMLDMTGDGGVLVARTATGRMKWAVGRDYAVQYGRGRPGAWAIQNYQGEWDELVESTPDPQFITGARPVRIRVTGLEQQELYLMTKAEAQAEGFSGYEAFIRYWAKLYKPTTPMPETGDITSALRSWVARQYRDPVWVIRFELASPVERGKKSWAS